IHRFHYLEPIGRYLLLDWVARHVDQASLAEISLPPFEFPETWFADMNIKYETQFPTPMGRVIDVSLLNGMPVGPGTFTARIHDPICPWNEGVWKFKSEDGLLQVSKVKTPECNLTIQGVSAIVYGTHDPETFSLRGWGDPDLEMQSRIRLMFPAQLPFIYEQF
ncbi:MAG: GNAT family N-acetyltransferase, partial [Gammaproteobacteria bacterium]|nr:GNAT family N-acetyltransferase [Gammaproteobacteria bacterium]